MTYEWGYGLVVRVTVVNNAVITVDGVEDGASEDTVFTFSSDEIS